MLRPRDGYGLAISVADVVETIGETTVRIRVARRLARTWVRQTKRVKPHSLTLKTVAIAAVDSGKGVQG